MQVAVLLLHYSQRWTLVTYQVFNYMLGNVKQSVNERLDLVIFKVITSQFVGINSLNFVNLS